MHILNVATFVKSGLLNEYELSILRLNIIVPLIYAMSDQRIRFRGLWLVVIFVDPQTKLPSVPGTFKDLFSTLPKTSRFRMVFARHSSDGNRIRFTLAITFLVCSHREPTAGP